MNLVIVPICFIMVIGNLNKNILTMIGTVIVVKQSLPVIVTGIISMITLITPYFA